MTPHPCTRFLLPVSPALWFGAFDDLWKWGKPRGFGGPYLQTPVRAGEPSDPFLMTGFGRKTLQLSHKGRRDAAFNLEIDFTGDGQFHHLITFDVASGETVSYEFPHDFEAHWLRLVPERATVATAQLTYD